MFGVLVSARASFWLDNKNRKLFGCLYEDFPKTTPEKAEKLNTWTKCKPAHAHRSSIMSSL